jgi:ferric-dicitrate binding protein FerR (iron transport regulator)
MNTDPQILELVRRYVDGAATAEETRELEAALRTDAALRRQFLRYLNLDAALGGDRLTATPVTPRGQTARRPARLGRLSSRALLAAAVLLLVGATVLVDRAFGPRGDTPRPATGSNAPVRDEATSSSIAILTGGVDLLWEPSGPAPTLNAPLAPGLLRLKRGVAQIDFFQGARLCIEGPAEIRLISAGEAFCSSGRFTAQVPPQARGFRIGTPKGDLVDLGTEFGLDLNRPASELHVFEGKVELHRPHAATRTFTTGEAVRLEQPATTRTLVANAAAFGFGSDINSRAVTSQRQAFDRWQGMAAQWNTAPGLRLRLDFQDPDGARALRNVAAEGHDVTQGTIVGCSWTQGRWPGKRALQFRSLCDRVRLTVPGDYPSLTLAAWLELHSLNRCESSLLLSQGVETGYVHWQILPEGSLCLGVGAGARPLSGDDYISPVVFTPERFGQWVHLAVVYDMGQREVRFYVDGRPISRHAMRRSVVLTPGIVDIGNWTPPADRLQRPIRNFTGCIDEFRLYARALNDEEVRKLSE